ncbi:hypothetical protein HVPorG_04064 (plasmid) [Roseomonas mucosa]|uniref:Lipoprotein n=1 Tax=Roseomonas mucosa TaxID=207340 RepID=A0A1S8D1A2_9PROT|nr:MULTISPECIES: hypothetical protein [Roseomonas]MBS5903916.1 hypothetical protein [Acetobacteraceae bacterium]MCG7354625.1 hypothetical protein [Roseomonas mucosa]MCG7359230.1 hypothetical protein [Roseomonas mucosa]MDT8290457.1 hypothetical protein [Roseomonas mucosa]MDT8295750.1 hypothetical protein [Roseomonas mucosa]
MPRILLPLVVLLPLAGCGLDAALDRMVQADDQKVCDGFGFQRGTDAYANCMMQQAAQREEETQRGMDRSQLEAAAKKLRDKH